MEDDVQKYFRAALDRIIGKQYGNQKKYAQQLNFVPQVLNDYLRGRRNFSEKVRKKIAVKLKIPYMYMLSLGRQRIKKKEENDKHSEASSITTLQGTEFPKSIEKYKSECINALEKIIDLSNNKIVTCIEQIKKIEAELAEIKGNKQKEMHKRLMDIICYISSELTKDGKYEPKISKILKIVYFADQEHLARYASPITYDTYIAVKDGPLPSAAYDILRIAKGDVSILSNIEAVGDYIEIKNDCVYPKREISLKIKATRRYCLDKAIQENSDLSPEQLADKATDCEIYRSGTDESEIFYFDIAKSGGARPEVLETIRQKFSTYQN